MDILTKNTHTCNENINNACEALQNFINFDGLTTDFDPTLNGFEVVRQEQDLFGNVYNIYKNAEGITYTLNEILLILQTANEKLTKTAKVRKSKTSSAKQAKQKSPSDLITLNEQLQNNCETQITNHAEPPATEKKEVNKQTKLKRIVVNDALDSDLVIKSALLEKLNKSNKNSLNFAEVLECLKNLNIQDSNDIVTNIENIITNYKNIDTSKLSTKKLNGDYKFSFLALLMNRTEPITILRSGTYKTLLCNITATCFSGETKDYLNKYEEILKQENIIDNYSEEILNRKLEKAVADTTKNTKTLIDYLCLNAEDIKTIELQNNPPLQLTENQIKEIRSELAENTISNHAEPTINTQAQNAPINATSEVYSQPNINNNNSQNESVVKQQAKEKQTFNKPQKYNNLKKDFSDYEKTDDYYSFIANKLNEVGIIYDALDLSGKFVSCKTNDKQRKKNGRYIVHLTEFNTNAGENLFFGYLGYQNHATSEWLECKFTNYSKAEYKSNAEIESNIKHLLENIEIKRREVEKKRKQERETAAALATKIYNKSDIYTQHYTEENPHPYLKKKNLYTIINGVKIIKAEVANKLVGDAYGKTNYKLFGSDGELKGDLLVIPIHNISGEFTSLQFIDINGNKSFLKDGAKSFFEITGNAPTFNNVAVAEGLATGASIKLALPTHKVFISFDAGNLSNVVGEIVKANSNAKITIFADNDKESHTGEIQAKKAIAENKNANIKYILTKGEVNDFNDRFADIFNAQQATKPLDKLKSAKDIFKDELESQLNEISKTSKTAGGVNEKITPPKIENNLFTSKLQPPQNFPFHTANELVRVILEKRKDKSPDTLIFLLTHVFFSCAIFPYVNVYSFNGDEAGELPTNLSCLLLSQSSTGKTSMQNLLLRPLNDAYNYISNERYKIEMEIKRLEKEILVKSGGGLIADDKNKKNKSEISLLNTQIQILKDKMPKYRIDIINQGTPEGKLNDLKENPCALICDDEAHSAFTTKNEEIKKKEFKLITECINGITSKHTTKTQGKIQRMNVRVAHAYQTQLKSFNKLGSEFTLEQIGQGSFPRMLFNAIYEFQRKPKKREGVPTKPQNSPEMRVYHNIMFNTLIHNEVIRDNRGVIIPHEIHFYGEMPDTENGSYDFYFEKEVELYKFKQGKTPKTQAIYDKVLENSQRLATVMYFGDWALEQYRNKVDPFPFKEKSKEEWEDIDKKIKEEKIIDIKEFASTQIPCKYLKDAYEVVLHSAKSLDYYTQEGEVYETEAESLELARKILKIFLSPKDRQKYENGDINLLSVLKSRLHIKADDKEKQNRFLDAIGYLRLTGILLADEMFPDKNFTINNDLWGYSDFDDFITHNQSSF